MFVIAVTPTPYVLASHESTARGCSVLACAPAGGIPSLSLSASGARREGSRRSNVAVPHDAAGFRVVGLASVGDPLSAAAGGQVEVGGALSSGSIGVWQGFTTTITRTLEAGGAGAETGGIATVQSGAARTRGGVRAERDDPGARAQGGETAGGCRRDTGSGGELDFVRPFLKGD